MSQDLDLSIEELTRYSRHLTLPNVGSHGQKKLKKASVLVVGAGGLGAPVLQYLSTAGIGEIGIVDDDNVDLSNLQRQVIHKLDHVGVNKAVSAGRWIKDINPNCAVNIHAERLTPENVSQICLGYDLICDCTDNFPTRYMLNDASLELKVPYIYGSILGFEGQVSVFNLRNNSPSYRDLVPAPPPNGLMPSCVEGGVLGVLPGLIGVLQATEIIKIILGIGKVLDGILLSYNALNMSYRSLVVTNHASSSSYQESVSVPQEVELPNNNYITSQELKHLLDQDSNSLLLVDVRSPAERDICFIRNSINYPIDLLIDDDEVVFKLFAQSQLRPVVFYCKSGFRSAKVVGKLLVRYENIMSLRGGILDWIATVDKTLAPY